MSTKHTINAALEAAKAGDRLTRPQGRLLAEAYEEQERRVQRFAQRYDDLSKARHDLSLALEREREDRDKLVVMWNDLIEVLQSVLKCKGYGVQDGTWTIEYDVNGEHRISRGHTSIAASYRAVLLEVLPQV